MAVNIDRATISHAEVAKAASDAGMSKTQLQELASQLSTLAHSMSFGDGSALAKLADEINQAASQVGQSTQAPEPFRPSTGGTAPPGT